MAVNTPSSDSPCSSFRIRAPTCTLTGVFGRESFSLYRTANGSSSIFGNTDSAKKLAQLFFSMAFSRPVSRYFPF